MESVVALFGLVGFFAGVVLYAFLFWVLIQRKERRSLERRLHLLIGSLLVWYAGNFFSLLLRQMDVSRVSTVLGLLDSAAFCGLALLPALLAQTHWLYYRQKFSVSKWEGRLAGSILVFLYLPLIFLPGALGRLFPAGLEHPMQRAVELRFPFLVVLAVSYYVSCYLEVRILKQSEDPVERAVFRRLLVIFLLIPLFNLYVFWPSGVRPIGDGWIISASLTSVLPSIVVAYYIYHYRFLHLVIHRGISTVLLLLCTLAVYFVGIRRVAAHLETEFDAPPLLIEAVFLAMILVLFPILTRWLSRYSEDFFSGEMSRHRRLAESISLRAPRLLDTRLLADFIEETLQRQLPAERVTIFIDSAPPPSEEGVLLPLKTPSGRIGSLCVVPSGAEQEPARREALRLIANEIALALERNRLVQSKLSLEKELAAKSHMEEIGRMAANVAHAVKNPLSSMKTLLQLLLEGENLTREQLADVEMMLSEVDRLAQTITNLLKFSRQDSGTSPPATLQEVNLEHFMNSVRSVFSGDLRSRDVQLETSLEIHPRTIRSDADSLSEIMGNLLSNALEASPRGGRIRVTVCSAGSAVRIVVEDSGPGISGDLRSRVFEPFVTTKTGGTGLGLAIVRKRVSQLGGTIELETPLTDHGTRFTVTLPQG